MSEHNNDIPQSHGGEGAHWHKAIIDAIPYMVFHTTRTGILTGFKPAEGLAPYLPPADFQGKSFSDVLPGTVASPVIAAIERAFASGQHETIEYDLIEHNTTVTYEGQIICCGPDEAVMIVRDITKDKQKDTALYLSNLTIEYATDAAFWITPDASIIHVNQAACDSLGYSREELLGLKVHDFDPNFQEDTWRERWIIGQQRGSFTIESTHRRKNGELFPVEIMANMFCFNGREYNCIFVRDITKRTQTAEALRLTQFSVDHCSDSAIWLDSSARLVYVNEATCHSLGYTSEELLNLTVFDIDETMKPEDWADSWDGFCEKKSANMESVFRRKDGSTFPVDIAGNYVRFEDKEYNCAFVRDITKRKQAEQALCESQERLSGLLNRINEVVFRMSLETMKCTFVSPAVSTVFGYDAKPFLETPMFIRTILHPDFYEVFDDAFGQIMKGYLKPRFEYKIIDPDGNERWLMQTNNIAFDTNGKPVALEGCIANITHMKKYQEEIEKNLEEKDALLREIHHRVKNNLQIISSLLTIQSSCVKDETAREALLESRNRVFFMARVHEHLYGSWDVNGINMESYVKDLVDYLQAGYGVEGCGIDVDVSGIVFDIDTAIPCGLIINELVSNAFKYAYKDRNQGKLVVQIACADKRHVLSVADDGPGLPEGLDIDQCTSMGLRLVALMTDQLGGTLNMTNTDGAVFDISFPEASCE